LPAGTRGAFGTFGKKAERLLSHFLGSIYENPALNPDSTFELDGFVFGGSTVV
jgi:hypothetical protein